jgi:hypothetical protein
MQGGTKALGIWILTVVGAAAWSLPVPAQDADPLTRIAFGSCAHQAKPQPIWDAVLDYHPELFIFTGDNVYGDVTSAAVTELREAYARAAAIEGYAEVRATVPVLATWDDHDYGRNDAGADFAHKAAAKQLFLDFWRVPHDDPRRTRDGIYHAETIGPEGMRVQIVLLDTRSFRSPLRSTGQPGIPGKGPYLPDPDPAKTMLGAAQWAWLRTQLMQPAELRLIVSSVQVLAEGHGWEGWGNLPFERTKLLDLQPDPARTDPAHHDLAASVWLIRALTAAASARYVTGVWRSVAQFHDHRGKRVGDHAVTRRRVVHVGRIIQQLLILQSVRRCLQRGRQVDEDKAELFGLLAQVSALLVAEPRHELGQGVIVERDDIGIGRVGRRRIRDDRPKVVLASQGDEPLQGLVEGGQLHLIPLQPARVANLVLISILHVEGDARSVGEAQLVAEIDSLPRFPERPGDDIVDPFIHLANRNQAEVGRVAAPAEGIVQQGLIVQLGFEAVARAVVAAAAVANRIDMLVIANRITQVIAFVDIHKRESWLLRQTEVPKDLQVIVRPDATFAKIVNREAGQLANPTHPGRVRIRGQATSKRIAHDDDIDARPIIAVMRRIAEALGIARDIARLFGGEPLLRTRFSLVELQRRSAVIARQLPHLGLVRQRQPLRDLDPHVTLKTLQPPDRNQLSREGS